MLTPEQRAVLTENEAEVYDFCTEEAEGSANKFHDFAEAFIHLADSRLESKQLRKRLEAAIGAAELFSFEDDPLTTVWSQAEKLLAFARAEPPNNKEKPWK